jgi:hypothetical protein
LQNNLRAPCRYRQNNPGTRMDVSAERATQLVQFVKSGLAANCASLPRDIAFTVGRIRGS